MKWRRFLFPILAVCVVAAVVAWLGTRLSHDPTPLPGLLASSSDIVQREDMFPLGTNAPLRFELHPGFLAVELVANAGLRGSGSTGTKDPGAFGAEAFTRLRAQPEGATVVALELRFEKDDGTWTLWQPYSVESMARFFTLPDGKGLLTSREHFPLSGPPLVSLDDAYLRFQLAAGSESQWPELPRRARTLEVRVSPSLGFPPWCDTLLVRVAGVSQTPVRKLSYLWERLSSVDQKSLSYVSALGERGLDEGQKRALLAEHRVLLAPNGMDVVENVRIPTLVHRNVNLPIQPVRDVVRFDTADTRHVVAFRLGARRQHVRLSFSPESPAGSPLASAGGFAEGASKRKVTVLWEGLRSGESRSEEIPVGTETRTRDRLYSEGTLYVQADGPVRVVASEVKAPGSPDEDPWIVPVPGAATRTDAFALLPGEPLRYEFAPERDATLEVRVDLRARLDAAKVGTQANLRALRRDGSVAAEVAVAVPAVASRFDSLTDPSAGNVGVTEALLRYVVLPPGVTALEITGDAGLLANAYSRPRGLAKLGVHLSASLDLESERAVAEALETASWFAVRPAHPVLRVEAPLRLYVQPVARAFAPTPSGAWEEALTRVPGPTRKVVVPRFSELKEDVALPSSVGAEMVLVGGKARARVRFLEDPLSAGVLLFHRLSRTPVEAQVRVDGVVAWRGFLPFQQGESRLPAEAFERYLSGRDALADVVVETRSPEVEGRFVLAGAVPAPREGDEERTFEERGLYAVREVQPVPRGAVRDFVLRKLGGAKEIHSGVFLPVADTRRFPRTLEGSFELSLLSVPGLPDTAAFPPALRFLPGFTFAKRRVEFAVPSEGLHPLIGTETGLLTEVVPFVVVLDEDLPAGERVVRLRNTSASDAYAYLGTVRAEAPRAARLVALPRVGALPGSGPKGPPSFEPTPGPTPGGTPVPALPGSGLGHAPAPTPTPVARIPPAPDEHVETAAGALRQVARARAQVYSRDVGELGGTRNVQGRLLRSLDAGLFLRVELSLAERECLVTDALWRRTFLSSLLHGLESGNDR